MRHGSRRLSTGASQAGSIRLQIPALPPLATVRAELAHRPIWTSEGAGHWPGESSLLGSDAELARLTRPCPAPPEGRSTLDTGSGPPLPPAGAGHSLESSNRQAVSTSCPSFCYFGAVPRGKPTQHTERSQRSRALFGWRVGGRGGRRVKTGEGQCEAGPGRLAGGRQPGLTPAHSTELRVVLPLHVTCALGPGAHFLGCLVVRTEKLARPGATRWRPLLGKEMARWPPAVPRAWWVRGSGLLEESGVVTPEAGDLGLGLSIGTVCQEDVPSAVHHGKIFYQRNLS